MTKLMMLFIAAPFLTLTTAHAHGEDQPGPNGGFVRMPGAFHTELVLADANRYEIYLLDMGFKNPTTENSTVSTTFLDSKKRTTNVSCKASGTKFLCTIPKNIATAGFDIRKEQAGKISVLAKRGTSQGNSMSYDLPLKHAIEKKSDSGHDGHHH